MITKIEIDGDMLVIHAEAKKPDGTIVKDNTVATLRLPDHPECIIRKFNMMAREIEDRVTKEALK